MIADPASAELLHERAQRLAERQQERIRTDQIEVIVVRLGGEQYAIPVVALHGVHPLDGLTPVPCTPPAVAGILNLRGEIVTVLGLAVLLGAQADGEGEYGDLLTVEGNQHRVGLLVDEVVEITTLTPGVLDASASGHDFIVGISEARIALLDLDRLLVGQRFEVREEIG